MNLQAGTPIDRYVIEDVLGRGGNATVYRVKLAILGTSHALKVLHGERAPGMAERLIHEGQLQAKLDPRAVVPVTDVLTVNGNPALLMPLVPGCSLRDILRRYQPTEEETAYLLLGIARGLEAAHAQDITHRDLRNTAIYLGNTARIRALNDQLDGAHRDYREALAMHRQTGSRTQEAITLFNMGDLYYQTRDFEQSGVVMQQAISVAEEVFPQLVGVIHGTLAKVLARQGDHQQALEAIQAGEPIMRGWSYKLELAKFIAKKATVYCLVSQIDQARASLVEAGQMHAELGGQDPDVLREVAEARALLTTSEAHS